MKEIFEVNSLQKNKIDKGEKNLSKNESID